MGRGGEMSCSGQEIGYRVGNRKSWVDLWQVQNIFSSAHLLILGPTQTDIKWLTWAASLTSKAAVD
jgi:hypothetical protein